MPIVTHWTRPVRPATGQDHLGTIAPGESIFAEQLPGITSQTSRARYYSFYPWLLRELERRSPEMTAEDTEDTVRRAECLFALAAIRHAQRLGEDESLHGAGMVGREKLGPAIRRVDEARGKVYLGDLAGEDESLRYFGNRLGGLGQYYFGPLRELGILGGDTRSRDLRYTEERGDLLADVFGRGVNAEPFFQLLRRNVVSVADLDEIASFCPCGLTKSPPERTALLDLLVDSSDKLGDESSERRATIALVLDLAARRAAPDLDFSSEFRASTYSAALLGGASWTVPERFAPAMHAWHVFAKHELLSVAFQGLFWAALTACEAAGVRNFRDAPELAAFAVDRLQHALPTSAWKKPFSQLASERRLPALSAWDADEHEIKAGRRILERERTPQSTVRDALDVLTALLRRANDEDPYARLHFEGSYFERFPLNLRTFLSRARRDWWGASVEETLGKVLVWTLRTHWRVALLKLTGSNPRDTFKVRPLEGRILIVEAPAPTYSTPRIHRVVGLLHDLGILAFGERERPILTKAGEKLRGGLLG